MALSLQQIEQDLATAGWPASAIPTAAAIIEAESGGDPNAIQKGQPAATTGWGLAQITPGNPSLLDPIANLRAALAKFQGAGNRFTPWTTFTGGQFQQFLPGAQQAFAGLGGLLGGGIPNPASSVGGAITGAVTSTGHGLADAGSATLHNAASWAKNNVVGLVVGLVVALVLFGEGQK